VVNRGVGRKVVFVNRFFYPDHSATSQLLSDLAFDLARGGVVVRVVTSRLRYDDPAASLAGREEVGGVGVVRVATTRFGRGRLVGRALDYLSFYVSAGWALWRELDARTVVVAKTDPPLISVVAAAVARLRGAELVNWLQDLFPEVAGALGMRLGRGAVGGALRGLRNWSLRAARANVVLGRCMAERVIAEGVPAEQVEVVHNWADGAEVRPVVPGANALRREWGLDGRFVVGYSGNLGRAHEFATVLEAAERLRGREDVVFLFIGAGAQRRQVEEEAARRGLGNVLFKPYQPRERLHESLSAGDVHLVSLNPALEGLIVPSKFYGIAAAGRPTLFVGDTDGEIARLLWEGDCGYAVAAGDGAGLAARIETLAGDRGLCDAMGARARRLFEGRFDRAVAVRRWGEVLGTKLQVASCKSQVGSYKSQVARDKLEGGGCESEVPS